MSIHDRDGEKVRIRCSSKKESETCDHGNTYRVDLIESKLFALLTEKLATLHFAKSFIDEYNKQIEQNVCDECRGFGPATAYM